MYSIRKHEIFAQYIEKLKQNNREYLETVLDTVTDFMIHSDNYDEISITDLEKTGITSGDIRKTVNSGILLSKKLVFHEGTIARNEKEVVYFVFDEMRDYCLARQILLNNISAYNVDGESVIEKLKQLKATGASCTEGVIHYCYVFFKTDELVSKLGQTEKMCNSILDLYRIPEGGERKSYWSMRYREELQNLGLRIILTSGLELTDFEITYIQDCLRKDPYEDGGMFFDTMLDGTLYGGIYNLDIYLGILFGLKNKDAILNTFHTISARNNMDDRFIPEDFIKYYNELSDSERKLQIQKIAELFLLCFKLHDKDKQEELEDFFYNLPTHDKVQNDMILEMRIAIKLYLEGKGSSVEIDREVIDAKEVNEKKVSTKSNDQGRAYEYAWMQTLYKAIAELRKTRIVENSSLVANEKAWSLMDEDMQEIFMTSAGAAIDMVLELEPRMAEVDSDELTLEFQKDGQGVMQICQMQ